MFTRFLVMSLFAAALTACGDAADFRKKVINSDNGEPLILFTDASYWSIVSFLNLGELQVVDGTGFCKSGTATVPPAVPAAGDKIAIAFADCVDENGIKFNNSIEVSFNRFDSWDSLEFTLGIVDLTAEAAGFVGIAAFSGAVDYVVEGNTGSVTSASWEAAVPDGAMGRLMLTSLDIALGENSDDAAVIETSVSGDGEIYTAATDTVPARLSDNPVLKQDSSDDTLLCPQTGALRLTATEDGSFASLEYPSGTDNVYQTRTNGSFINQYDCI